MKTLHEQQAKAWRLAPDDAHGVRQDADGNWYATGIKNVAYRWLYRGVIGDWDRRDTLQTREDWEDMKPNECDKANGDYDDWVPEGMDVVGWQFYQYGEWHTGMNKHNHRQNTEKAGIPIREIYAGPTTQTKADKKRKTQINDIIRASFPADKNCDGPSITFNHAENLHDNCVRVLKPGEAIGRRLSEDGIQRLADSTVDNNWLTTELITATERAIFGESDDGSV